MYESRGNLTRFRRTLDFVAADDRVFEVGIGKGYLATRLLRDGAAASYHGIDIVQKNVASTLQTLAANGVQEHATAELGDLYALTREEIERWGADLVICCEVLEHVPDPEHAVQVLADALPDGAELLLSVPLLGRLENIWGHIAMFGVPRVRAMVEAAGLRVHLVEPLENQWVFLLCSRDEQASPRAARAAAALPDTTSALEQPPDRPRSVDNVAPASVAVAPARGDKGVASVTTSIDGNASTLRVRIDAGPPRRGWDLLGRNVRHGGISIPVEDLLGARLELELTDIAGASAFSADFFAGHRRVSRWVWDTARRPNKKRVTFTLRGGLSGGHFRRVKTGDLRSADRMELTARVRPGTVTEFALTRLGWIR